MENRSVLFARKDSVSQRKFISVMQGSLSKCRLFFTILPLVVSSIVVSSIAQAQQLNIDLMINGTSAGHWSPAIVNTGTGLGIYDITYPIAGGSLTVSNVSLATDPFISASVDVLNNTAGSQNYTLIFTLPIVAVASPGSKVGGSVQGGVTDANNNGTGILSTVGPGSALFFGRIDGVNVFPLFPDVKTITAPFAGGSASDSVNAGLPGGTIPGFANPLISIGIQHEFSLTAGDRATFTSFFIVEPLPIPEPASITLLAIGGLMVLRLRRRC